jgi:hypothetical protein
MVTFQQRFVRYALVFMATLTVSYSLFWDGWSFSGPLFRYSVWLQPMVFFFGVGALLYSLSKRPYAQKIPVKA